MARKPAKKTAAKKKRGATAKTETKATVPAWVWLVTGVLGGLFIAFLVFLQTRSDAPIAPAPTTQAPAKPKAVEPKPAETAKVPAKEESSRFEFYNILPQLEVLVPDLEEPKPDKPGEAPRPVTREGLYVLQSGSFRKYEDADRRKASLAILGVESEIQKVTVKNNETWHRVRVGPFKKLDDLNEVRALLHENKIDTLLIKIKG